MEKPELKLPTVCDDELLHRGSSLCAQLSHFLHHIHTVLNPSEGHMFEVEVFSLLQGDEELRAVGVPSGIGHGKNARARVPDVKVLIFELVAVDRFTS